MQEFGISFRWNWKYRGGGWFLTRIGVGRGGRRKLRGGRGRAKNNRVQVRSPMRGKASKEEDKMIGLLLIANSACG